MNSLAGITDCPDKHVISAADHAGKTPDRGNTKETSKTDFLFRWLR